MRAFGYFRDAAPGGRSLAEQNKAFLDYCGREGLEAADTFVEAGPGNGLAPGFRQLVASLRASNTADVVVVVPAVGALGVSHRDAVFRYLQLEALGARVAAIDAAAPAGDDQIIAWLREEDGTSLGARVRAAMRRKAVKGEVLGRPPYGYKVGSRRRLELIPEEAVVVRYIFRLYLHERMGIRLIARRLNEEGLKTRRGGNWSMVSIRDILRNRAYLGTYSRFGVRVPGSHPPLVSADDFGLVQDRLNARRTSFAPRVASHYLLSGLAECGYCGNKLIGVSRKQSWKRRDGKPMSNAYRYYQCESRTNQSVCGYHTRRAADLEEQVRAALAETIRSGGLPEADEGDAGRAEQAREVQRLRARARAIERRFEGYVAAVTKGRLARERLHELARAAAADRLAIDDLLDAAERRSEVHASAAERRSERALGVVHVLDAWQELPFAELQAGLRDAVARITVTDDCVRVSLRP
ncbi:MAG: recombinase family protein [Chloroflexota bacterium]|nr:recombinase family protein [Chloroflexota bacterium]